MKKQKVIEKVEGLYNEKEHLMGKINILEGMDTDVDLSISCDNTVGYVAIDRMFINKEFFEEKKQKLSNKIDEVTKKIERIEKVIF